MSGSFDRTPPKSGKQIRSTLNSIHNKAEVEPHSGALRNGPSAHAPFNVGMFLDLTLARDFQKQLREAGVFSKTEKRGKETAVIVDEEDRKIANEIFQQHRSLHPNRRPTGAARRFDFMIFGLIVGLTLGIVFVMDAWQHRLSFTIPLTFTSIGGLLGHFYDRMLGRHRQTGKWGIGVWEFLIIASVPALILLAVKLVPEVILSR